MTKPLLTQLAARLARPVPQAERMRARMHLLDWLACAAGARDTEAGHVGGAIARTGWERATYAGGALGMGDEHRAASLHPGAVIWPVAMSMSSASMDARLDAAVRGYEAMIAVGAAFDAHHRATWHPTATAGIIGSAAAFGSLIGFAPIEYANAMGNAASVSGGLWHERHDDVLTKQWHVYHAVRTGRDAAMHVHYGATGPLGILESPQGLFAAMTREPGALANDGEGWLIKQVGFKPFAAINAAEEPIEELEASERPVGEAEIADKMRRLARLGGVPDADAETALKLALHGDDGAAIEAMVERWLA